MNINLTFNSNVPSFVIDAANFVASFLGSLFSSPVTTTIDVGYGTVGTLPVSTGALGQSMHPLVITNGVMYSTTEAAALGISDPNNQAVGGSVGLNATVPFTFDPNHRAVLGQTDAIGVLEHEMTEVLGRTAGFYGLTSHLDTFRYTAPGQTTNGPGGYFSVDGGNTPIRNYSVTGDHGDWLQPTAQELVSPGYVYDAFTSQGNSGHILHFSNTDLLEMSSLGYGSNYDQILCGGTGSRPFVFNDAPGHTIIEQFQSTGKGHNIINVSRNDFTSFRDLMSYTTDDNNGSAVISLDGTGTNDITLFGVSKSQLHRNDFRFH